MKFLAWLDGLVKQFITYLEGLKIPVPPKAEPEIKPKPEVKPPPTPIVVGEVPAVPLTYADYEVKFHAAKVRPEHMVAVKTICSRILNNSSKYEAVESATGVPWYLIACLHSLESGLNFSTHLHNGDPLTARTTHVPAGRPSTGTPPFEWVESAIDALESASGRTWTLGSCLDYAEKFNGLGYRKRKMPSPYLWSFTDQYSKGKYVADGIFDPNAISKQAGVVAILKTLGLPKSDLQ